MNDTRFDDLLEQIRGLHARKAQDYGDDEDPFANIRASMQFGVPAWQGALIRLNDKVHRLARFAKRGQLANESAEDSMLDIAVYALIALLLYREQSPSKVQPQEAGVSGHPLVARAGPPRFPERLPDGTLYITPNRAKRWPETS